MIGVIINRIGSRANLWDYKKTKTHSRAASGIPVQNEQTGVPAAGKT